MQQNFRKRTFIILLYTLLRCGNINSNVLFQAKVHKKTLQFIEAQWDSNSKLLWHTIWMTTLGKQLSTTCYILEANWLLVATTK